MVGAYGWAFLNPIRKLWYNLTITAASVVVAVFIGGIEALGLIGDKMGLEGGVWRVVSSLNDNLTNFGFTIAGVFMASWVVSAIIYRAKGYDNLPFQQLWKALNPACSRPRSVSWQPVGSTIRRPKPGTARQYRRGGSPAPERRCSAPADKRFQRSATPDN